jgi:hypothetical protein
LGVNAQHLSYPANPSVQVMGTRFVVKKLRNARTGDNDEGEGDNDSREDDRSQDDDQAQDNDRSQEDDSSQDDDSRPPYSPSPRPVRRPIMGSIFDSWRKAFQDN